MKLYSLLILIAFTAGAYTASPAETIRPLPDVTLLSQIDGSMVKVPSNREYADNQAYGDFLNQLEAN